MKLSFALASSSSAVKGNKSLKRKSNAFGNNNDDDDDATTTTPTSLPTALSRSQKLKQAEARAIDASVFEYDQVYDDMKSVERNAKKLKDEQSAQRKPQYIQGLMQAAKQRELDRTRAEDTMVHREREREGGEFEGKDEFVTPAYLAQQEEHRRAEEEEKRLAASKKKQKSNTTGSMTHFYSQLLNQQEQQHQAVVNAVSEKQGHVNEHDDNVKNDDDLVVAKEASQRLGHEIELDDENRIVDHRQLLTGGLNLASSSSSSKKGSKVGFSVPIAQRREQQTEDNLKLMRQEQQRVGEDGQTQSERIQQSRQRQSEMMQQQLLKLQQFNESQQQQLTQPQTSAKRNGSDKVEELKRAALERRKAREVLLNQSS